MFSCPCCKTAFESFKKLRVHLRAHQLNGEWQHSYKCGQGDCPKTFSSVKNWRDHINRYHEGTLLGSISAPFHPNHGESETSFPSYSASSTSLLDDQSSLDESEPDSSITQKSLKCVVSGIIAQLRANSSATGSVIKLFVDGINEVASSVVDYAVETLDEMISSKMEVSTDEFSKRMQSVLSPADFLSSDWKQKEFFSKQPSFVKPLQMIYPRPRMETMQGANGMPYHKETYDSWQYIPLSDNLRSILSVKEVFQSILQCQPSTDGIISEFVDGTKYRTHQLFADSGKFSVALDLYYDDIETTNPLGSKTGVHKIGVFYFTIKNLPSAFTSSMANIHLLALAYTSDLKNYGYSEVLSKIAADIRQLETNGISIKSPDGEEIQLYASLAIVSGDNLGRHTIFGLVESFRAKYMCEICQTPLEEIQHQFEPAHFPIRSKEVYDSQLQEVRTRPEAVSECGIKGDCTLHLTKYWHLTRNWACDLMHDFCEGVGPYEVKLVLHHLIKNQRLFTLNDLNRRISNFAYGSTDIKNRPSCIVSIEMTDHSLKQKAMQFWALFRLLPLIIGDLIPEKNTYWEFYLDLRKIAEVLFAPKWTGGMSTYVSDQLSDHMNTFKRIFPAHNLLPKHHFLAHYPRIALVNGPPYKLMVASQEMKGNFFKRIAHVICNFKNIPLSLAWRHQYFAYFSQEAGKMNRGRTEVISGTELPGDQLPMSEEMLRLLRKERTDACFLCTKIVVSGTLYRPGQILVISNENEMLKFGRVIACASDDFTSKEKLVFIVELCETLAYETHMGSYVVRVSNDHGLVKLSDLLDFHPLDAYAMPSHDCYYISLRYHVF